LIDYDSIASGGGGGGCFLWINLI